MATTEYDFTQTRNQIIERAFRIIGVHSPGQSLPGEMAVQGSIALNTLVKYWQTKDLFLWNLKEETISFSANDTSQALGNHVLGIERAWYVQSNTNISIKIKSYSDYLKNLTSTSSADFPTLCAIDYDKSTPTLYLWPKAASAVDIHIHAYNRLKDLDSANDIPEIPQRFIQPLVYGLADVLADEYKTPYQDRKMIKDKADEYFIVAQSSDYEYEDKTVATGAYED